MKLKRIFGHGTIMMLLLVSLIGCTSDNSDEFENNSNFSSYEDEQREALTDEEAERLRGTGYHNTRPNSVAENIEINAAKVKCEVCGMHSDNGYNSKCDSCQEIYGH